LLLLLIKNKHLNQLTALYPLMTQYYKELRLLITGVFISAFSLGVFLGYVVWS